MNTQETLYILTKISDSCGEIFFLDPYKQRVKGPLYLGIKVEHGLKFNVLKEDSTSVLLKKKYFL